MKESPNPQAFLFYETVEEQIALHMGSNSAPVFKQTATDWLLNRRVWRPLTEERYFYQMEAVPPASVQWGGFVGGEPANNTKDGRNVYSVFRERHGEFHTMQMTADEYRKRIFESAPIEPFDPDNIQTNPT